MKNYYQHIPANPIAKQSARKIKHSKPLTRHQNKLLKLKNWLYKNYNVFSFSELKEKGQKLINIRHKGLKYAGFLPNY